MELWTVVFQTANGSSGGVAVLEGGKIFGGDSQFYYIGEYQLSSDRMLRGRVGVHALFSHSVTVFGMPARYFELNFSGTLEDSAADLSATVSGMPGAQMKMKLVRRA